MDNDLVKRLADELKNFPLEEEVRIMEVCGTHTTEFFRTGVKGLFPEKLSLVDGPGCPVCVTPNEYLDRAIEIGRQYKTIITTFGDMIKVPSSYSSLGKEKSEGMDIRVVYSPLDALELAEKNLDQEIIFISVGFETTAPTEAAVILEARKRKIKNLSFLSGNKLTPPAVKALLDAEKINIDAFILPGHVSAVIGIAGWRFISEVYNKPCVVAGFEDHDLIRGTLIILKLIRDNRTDILNEYSRVVKEKGNENAQEIMFKVFERSDSHWRGIGIIPESGLEIKKEFSEFDAFKKFPVTPPGLKEHAGCRCGELLCGLISPEECPLFGNACSPECPVGPCMVSTEGPCAAHYKYGGL